MDCTTRLDVDLVAAESDDEVSLLVELTAPASRPHDDRPPRLLQVVLDRSGSMGGGRLAAAREAPARVVGRLDPTDAFGVVSFDDEVEVTVPAAPLADKAGAVQAIRSVHSGGSTDLSAGLLRGLQQARGAATAAGGTLLVVSDGHANAGITDPAALGELAASARAQGLTVSTLGIGLGYDEELLAQVARGGAGNASFAAEPDAAAAAIGAECEGLLDQAVSAASLTLAPSAHVRGIRVHNDVPVSTTGGAFTLELGALYAGEQRRVLITLDVPAAGRLGLLEVATLTLRWVSLPDLVERTRTDAVCVNVVPGDQAAGRVPDPVVRTEIDYLAAQRAKQEAAEAMRRGDAAAALGSLRTAAGIVHAAMPCAAPDMRADLADDLAYLEERMRDVAVGELASASKATYADVSRKSRQRGRRPRGA